MLQEKPAAEEAVTTEPTTEPTAEDVTGAEDVAGEGGPVYREGDSVPAYDQKDDDPSETPEGL